MEDPDIAPLIKWKAKVTMFNNQSVLYAVGLDYMYSWTMLQTIYTNYMNLLNGYRD